jgi:hypothetical protein
VGEKGDWSKPSMLDRELALNNRYAVDGTIHFSAKSVRTNRLGAVTRYRTAHYAVPALPPVVGAPAAVPLPAPRLVTPRRAGAGTVDVDWRGSATAGWALYRSDGRAAALVAVGSRATAVRAPGPGTYCLSELDRAGHESAPSAPFQG